VKAANRVHENGRDEPCARACGRVGRGGGADGVDSWETGFKPDYISILLLLSSGSSQEQKQEQETDLDLRLFSKENNRFGEFSALK
jgi:hypothetical protein